MQTHARVLPGDDYFPELPPTGDRLCQAFDSSANEGADSARVMFLLSLAAARRSILIANAYFVPDDLVIRALVAARRRGVMVEVVTPSEKIDQRTVRIVGRERWGSMLEAGVCFYEYQPSRYHCKYMIVDDCWVSAGSANFDNRSFRLNDEANLNVHDRDFAAQHVAIFEKDKIRLEKITLADWRRRPWRERVVGRAAGLLRSQM